MARLTPRDIQEKEFSSGFRGYKEEEVDEFLDRITSSYEEVFKENIDFKEEVERLGEENKKYELIGERMQAALVAAQETADDVRKNATKEAENILREAEIKAHKMVQESRDQHRELQKSLAFVKQIEEEYRFKLKSTLQSYLKLLEEGAIGENKDVKRLILPEDMAALGERRREMEEREDRAKAAKAAPVKEEAPASAEDTAAKQKTEEKKEEAQKAEAPKAEEKKEAAQKDEAQKPETKAVEPMLPAAKAEATAEAAKEALIDDSKAKADALLEEIAAKAAEEKKIEDAKAAQKEIAQKAEEKKVDEAASAEATEDKPAGKQKTDEKKDEAKKEQAANEPFDKEAGKASAVSAEWEKLQEAVDEAVKATDKPEKAEKAAEAAESTMPGEMVETKKAPETDTKKAAETTENKAKAKDEKKEEKTGKSALSDIEIVEDESFWKDI